MLLVRAALLVLAAAGGLWAVLVGWDQWRPKPLRPLAERIYANQEFELDALKPVLAYIERTDSARTCNRGEPDEAAIVQHYALELAFSSGTGAPENGDAMIQRTRRDLRRALTCRPSQAFLWYALHRTALLAGTPFEETLPFLEMSYRLGPHEGWMMPSRNFQMVHFFQALPSGLKDRVRDEFRLIARDQPAKAGAILAIVNYDEETTRDLLAALESVPLEKRRALANFLDRNDLLIDIPGVDYSAKQPWRRNQPSATAAQPSPAPSAAPAPAAAPAEGASPPAQ